MAYFSKVGMTIKWDTSFEIDLGNVGTTLNIFDLDRENDLENVPCFTSNSPVYSLHFSGEYDFFFSEN